MSPGDVHDLLYGVVQLRFRNSWPVMKNMSAVLRCRLSGQVRWRI